MLVISGMKNHKEGKELQLLVYCLYEVQVLYTEDFPTSTLQRSVGNKNLLGKWVWGEAN